MSMHYFIIDALLYVIPYACVSTLMSLPNLFLEHSSSSGIECEIEYVHSITSTMVSDTQLAVPSNSALFKGFLGF